MDIRIFTLRFNVETERFDDTRFRDFIKDKEVISMNDHFFIRDNMPYLTLVISFHVPNLVETPLPGKKESKRDESWRDLLQEEDIPLFNTLRTWRNETAKQEGLPPYVICTNHQLALMVVARDRISLKALLRRIIKDKTLLDLLDRIINHAPPGLPPGKGLPIGNLTSQHFANIYLGELDHFVKEVLRIKGYVRYMDDILLFADDKPTLHKGLVQLRYFLADRLQLRLKNENVTPTPVTEGIPFLGFRIFPAMIRLDRRTLRRFCRCFRHREQEYLQGDLNIDQLNASVTAMFAHIAQGDTFRLRQKLIQDSLLAG
ncbi:MAG: hypothetical protein D3923_01635 [Candidatus Electrothrix sp. AR3]|nr:hypothetical protein [Candidatus Electrothrix sp. AR3]